MNGVVGMAHVLEETDLSEEQRLYVETIKNSGEALLVIINDVLDYSKIEADRLTLRDERFDLEKSVQDVIRLLQSSARDKGLVLAVDYQLDLPTRFMGDPGRIRQILTNLAGNAVKFTSEGSVVVRVLGKHSPDNLDVTLQITVEDTGIGIPEDMIEHVFGEFNQVENERNRQFDGTGLGLAITQRLVKMMKGRVWLTSQEGAGSTFGFEVTLPLDGPQNVILPRFGGTRAMVVDPSKITRDILVKKLEALGVEVVSCVDETSALAHLDQQPALVVIEHVVPKLDGLRLATELRARGYEAKTCLVSSTQARIEDRPERAAVDIIATRPLSRADLLGWLEGQPAETRARSAKAEAAQQARDEPPKVRRMRVLAAEDNKTNRLVFSKMLKNFDIELQFACDGQEAVDMYRSFEPDLIFMDISMPRMDGKEATRAIRKLEQTSGRHIPIVALTAHAMDGDDRTILGAGLDRYMTKPLRKPQIIDCLRQYCPEGVPDPTVALAAQAAG